MNESNIVMGRGYGLLGCLLLSAFMCGGLFVIALVVLASQFGS